jgi:hypothetical protein
MIGFNGHLLYTLQFFFAKIEIRVFCWQDFIQIDSIHVKCSETRCWQDSGRKGDLTKKDSLKSVSPYKTTSRAEGIDRKVGGRYIQTRMDLIHDSVVLTSVPPFTLASYPERWIFT